jgi:hypothetical protein
MTLQLELNPEMEARLAAQAALHGMAPEAYAAKLIDDLLPRYPAEVGRLTAEDIEEMSRKLSEGSENLPILPPEVNDRASYYEDRR